ncbi:MAG: S-layer homology domain-containing protein [Clostridia bacterium]|nr:S-layer homology domain-containing protein [Clostridia bacterium]
MKNRLLTLFVAFAMITTFCSSAVAAANTDIIARMQSDSVSGGYVVSGSLNGERENLYVSLEVKDSVNKTVYIDQMLVSGNTFTFPALKLHPKNASGTYKVFVYGEDLGTADMMTFEFKGALDQIRALIELNKADTAEEVRSVLESTDPKYSDALPIDMTDYNSLTSDSKDVVGRFFAIKTYPTLTSIPDGYVVTDSDIEALIKSMNEVSKGWNNVFCAAKFNDISSAQALSEWITNYKHIYDADNPDTDDVNENELYKLVKDCFGEATFLTKVKAYPTVYNQEEATAALLEAAALTIVKNNHYTEVKRLYDNFPEVFGINTSNLAKVLRKIGSDEEGALYTSAKGDYASYTAAGNRFNQLLEGYLSDDDEGGGYTGGGGGGGGGRYNTVVQDPITTQTEDTDDMPFPDMAGALWANEAVTALKQRNIICGDEYGNFNPDNNVTRAEFIKMAVLATGIELADTTDSFSDVSPYDWFYTYVNAAKAESLIIGDDNNLFRPYELISRQDMAVILYRAYGADSAEKLALPFADRSDISDYATEAVAYFYSKGIVKGVGDNIFAPLDNATRAEAAQMIYNTFMK